MSPDAQRATQPTSAVSVWFATILILFHCIMKTWLTLVVIATLADKESDRAAVHAFEINELVTVNLTKFLTISKMLTCTPHTEKIKISHAFI